LTNLMITSPAAVNPSVQHEGTVMLLLQEALARSRMREAEEAARKHALVRALVAGRRWRMLARYAERRAAAAERVSVAPRERRVLRSV
jgi:hypothetical protein